MIIDKLINENQDPLQGLHNKVNILLNLIQDMIQKVDTGFSGYLRKIERKQLLKILSRL